MNANNNQLNQSEINQVYGNNNVIHSIKHFYKSNWKHAALAVLFITVLTIGTSFNQNKKNNEVVQATNKLVALQETEIKLQVFEQQKKDPLIAIGSSLLLPGLGHAYTESLEKSLPYIGIEALGVGIALSDEKNIGTGIAIALAGKALELIDVLNCTNAYNSQLLKELDIKLAFNYVNGGPAFVATIYI